MKLRTTALLLPICLSLSLSAGTSAHSRFERAVEQSAQAAANYPAPAQGNFILRDFRLDNGEIFQELRLHYRTIGTIRKSQAGAVENAVLIMHGTGGSGAQFLSNQFAGVLFGPGQLLDASKYFIILPDDIGHGASSKPSDGMHARFPHYGYGDMITAEYRLVTQGLGINHLRLVMGTSMGGMHTWLWGERYPDFMDALMPLASLPVQIAGRNRMTRRMVIDSITKDPAWNNGEYKEQPRGLTAAVYTLLMMGSSPLQWQKQAPTRDEADKLFDQMVKTNVERIDANDMLYQFDSSRDYNPQPRLEDIKAPLVAINSADDQVNPPELGIMEKEIKRVPHGTYVLIPISDQTRGHGTHTLPAVWKQYLAQLLDESIKR
jgi:homoserine O-acetyltransferase